MRYLGSDRLCRSYLGAGCLCEGYLGAGCLCMRYQGAGRLCGSYLGVGCLCAGYLGAGFLCVRVPRCGVPMFGVTCLVVPSFVVLRPGVSARGVSPPRPFLDLRNFLVRKK